MTSKTTKNTKGRAPRVFTIDDTAQEKTAPTAKKKPKPVRKPKVVKQKAVLTPVPEEAAQRFDELSPHGQVRVEDLTPPPPQPINKRFRWSAVFWAALAGLISLGVGLWIDQLIAELFARNDWLGWLAVALVAVLLCAMLAVALREIWGLMRMAKIDQLREDAEGAIQSDDSKAAKIVIRSLLGLYRNRPDTARGRTALEEQQTQIIDGANMIALAERDLMRPLDKKARALVMGSAKRVSVVTAVSPRAIVDIGFVLMENIKLIRNLADLYGGRPGTFGFWRLLRNVIGHLAITGSIAVGEGVLQQIVGHGLAARLSSKLGEGIVNGLLTARIGIAAIDVCRPLPFSEESRPTVRDFMGELVRFSQTDTENKPD